MHMRTSACQHTHTAPTCENFFFDTHLYISCEFSAAKKSVTICGCLAFIALQKKKKKKEDEEMIAHMHHT